MHRKFDFCSMKEEQEVDIREHCCSATNNVKIIIPSNNANYIAAAPLQTVTMRSFFNIFAVLAYRESFLQEINFQAFIERVDLTLLQTEVLGHR